MTTAQKLWLGFGTLIVLMIMVLVIVFSWVRMISEQIDEIALLAGPIAQNAFRLETKSNELTAEVSRYLQTPTPESRQSILRYASEFERLLKQYRGYKQTDADQELIDQVRDRFDRYQALSLEAIEDRQAGEVAPEKLTALLDVRSRLDDSVHRIRLLQEARMQPVRERVVRSIGRLQRWTLLLLVSGVVVASLAAVAISRGVLHTENALRQTSFRNAQTFANALDGIITIDGDGRVLEFNPAAERIFGYNSEEIEGQEMARLIVPESFQESHRAGLLRQQQGGPSKILGRRLELTAKRSSGEEFAVEVAIIDIGTSKTRMFTGFVRDISDSKRAEAALGERVKLLQLGTDVGAALTKGDDLRDVLHGCTEALVRNLDAAFARIWLYDPDDRVLLLKASSGMYTHLDGGHARIPLGKFKIGRIAEDQRPHLTNEVIGDPQVPEQEWAKREGMVAFAGYPLLVDRRLVGVMGMFFKQPISEVVMHGMRSIANEIAVGVRHELAQTELMNSHEELEDRVQERTEELHASNQALVRSNHELEQFASVASHDLQEPLRKIQAFGERLQSKYAAQLDDQGRQYIERMQNSASRMRTLIDDLLTFSRITTKARPFEDVDLAEIAEEVVSDLEARIHDTGGEVILEDLPTIQADPLQIRQLLQNLISNGLKFRRPDVPPVVRVWQSFTENDPETCVLHIADNGIGFDETYLDRIFEVFQRLHGRLEYEGTGMGLAICRKIAERHGGSITAESQVGSGSTFIIRLPREHLETETAE
jgi:PAS domain S-box-containing protein